MNIYDAMNNRSSIRDFENRPIEPEVLQRVLEHARRAPSWKNCQPLNLHIVSGACKNRLASRLQKAASDREPDCSDEPWQTNWPAHIKKRMFQLGMQLYEHLGIDRKDKAAREQQMMENYNFFGAPCVFFMTTHKQLAFWPELDIGIFLGFLQLALMEEGLGCCFQGALAAWPYIIKEELKIDDDQKLLLGMSVGYAKKTHINNFKPGRLELEQFCTFHQ